jgi:signal transduction histidine kinase
MISLINNLLEVNHSDEKISISYDFKKIDILYLLEQTLLEFYGETTKKGIELIFIKPESPISPVNCDEKTIRIVFQNLIENAIKYSNKGGKIFVFLKQKDKNVEISFFDNGIGISESDKENIFKKFYRTKRAIKKDSVGSGIGLFTTKNIVEKHGGKIWFENTKGGGTTFFVTLPIL